jgi:RES domain-containing protein
MNSETFGRLPVEAPGSPEVRIRVWRICRAVHAADAFSGEGARRFGGRWNSRGVRMVYASTSLSLAAIEYFIHLEPMLGPDDLVYVSATLPAGEPALQLKTGGLPADWRSDEIATRELGDGWIHQRSSLALRVPSVPIPIEDNVLINPLHPRMAEMRIDPPQPFVYDGRMFRPTIT